MCSPAAIPIIIAVAAAAGATVAAVGGKNQGDAEYAAARYNARQQENEAVRTRNKGVEEENLVRRHTAELVSRQRAQLAAQGLDIGTGSALQLQTDAATIGEADALRIRSNFENQALQLEEQALLTKFEGRARQSAARTRAIGSLISGSAQGAGAFQGPRSSGNSASSSPSTSSSTSLLSSGGK